MSKKYSLEDLKDAFESGYYEAAGDDSWYNDHDDEGDIKKRLLLL